MSITYQTFYINNPTSYVNDEEIHFSVKYTYNTVTFWTTTNILFALSNLTIAFIWIMRIWIWIKGNPDYISRIWALLLLGKSIELLLDTWSEGMFYFLFCITGYWFCFFKF